MISYYRGSTGREIKIWKGLFLSKRLSADLVSNVVGKRFIGTMTQTWLFSETKRRASCLGISGHARALRRYETAQHVRPAPLHARCHVVERGLVCPSVRPFPNVGAAALYPLLVGVLIVGLSYGARNVLSYTGCMLNIS